MKFKIGCNYWASNAGTEMWRRYNSDVIRKDFSALKANGIEYLRVFPNWRDFQPVSVLMGGGHSVQRYIMEDESYPDNPYYLDKKMLERFLDFCKIAEEYDMKLIVGLLTGWMSGRLFIPPVLYDKNIYTHPTAQSLEQKFIKGFVTEFKTNSAVYAWDLGNECNCMDSIESRDEADNWTMMMSNAIRACDSSRVIISGMHSLKLTEGWTIEDQAASTDILTTHPYPFWVEHCSEAEITSIQTLMHAACQTKYYSNIGKKPCLVEEIGTMGPMVCDDETAAGFMRVNLYSNWSNGAEGVLWWCAFDQTLLMFPPYDRNMCETELGMLDNDFNVKPVLKEVRRFREWYRNINFELPSAQEDGVCLLTNNQDNWGIAYMTYVLSKQAEANISFAYADSDFPEYDMYLLPSVCGINAMSAQRWAELKNRIYNGAVLYISNDDAVLSGFEDFTGLRVRNSKTAAEYGNFVLNDRTIEYKRSRCFEITPTAAEVLVYDENNCPLMTCAKYGKGKVFYLNFPLEKNLLGKHNAFEGDSCEVYRYLFNEKVSSHIVQSDNRYIGITIHRNESEIYAVIINYSAAKVKAKLQINHDYVVSCVIKGDTESIEPFDALIIKLEKKEGVIR